MRRVIASEFVSLDGVFEAPEKWHFPYMDDEMVQEIMAGMGQSDAMLIGRVNYEEWAAFWPEQDPAENPAAAHINGVRKYVVSTTLEEPLEWQNSTLIKGNVSEEVARLKGGEGGDIVVTGSGRLVRSLLKDGLVDELRLMVFPIVVGRGKRLFGEAEEEKPMALVEAKPLGPNGVIVLTYRPAEKEVEG
jgi:dihydrofolate reductase